MILARVRQAQTGDALAKAGVMIRESLDPQSAHVFALTTGTGAVRFQRRRKAGGPSVRSNAGTGAAPWLKVERRGATFTASRSSDGTMWQTIGTDIIPMTDTVFVGLAVTSGSAPSTTTADFSTVSVTSAAPLVATAAPAGWSSADVGLPALAGSESENAGTFSITWNNVGAGTYSLTAVATDNGGAMTTSAARTVTVNAPPPGGAHALFTASVDDSTLVTHYVLDIFTSGADPNTATPIATQDLGKPPVVNGIATWISLRRTTRWRRARITPP